MKQPNKFGYFIKNNLFLQFFFTNYKKSINGFYKLYKQVHKGYTKK